MTRIKSFVVDTDKNLSLAGLLQSELPHFVTMSSVSQHFRTSEAPMSSKLGDAQRRSNYPGRMTASIFYFSILRTPEVGFYPPEWF